MLYFYALLISFFWGIIPIIYNVLLKRLNNVTVMAITTTFYVILLLVLIFYNREIVMKDLNKITNHEYLWIFIATFFGVFIANYLYYYILKKGSEVAILTALMYTCPIITLLGGYFFLNDKISQRSLIGILFIVTGVICICLK
jgi:drug/metabolite transporter (DMT)-like permease